MRLLDDDANRPLDKIWVYLTVGEAREIAAQLSALFDEERHSHDWHSHFVGDDGASKELTLALYDPDAQTGDPRWHEWFKDDRWEPSMFENGPTT
jgi:hypothetical protein